jgi:hypothetical protein
MPRTKTSLKDHLLLWSLILLALGVFGGACYGALRIVTGLPVWAIILISAVVAIAGFAVFVWTHSTNGFDGIYGDPPGVLLSGQKRPTPGETQRKD